MLAGLTPDERIRLGVREETTSMIFQNQKYITMAALAISFFAAEAVYAGPLAFTISGTYGTITGGGGTAPFDNGSTFSVSFTVPDPTPLFPDASRVFFAANGPS